MIISRRVPRRHTATLRALAVVASMGVVASTACIDDGGPRIVGNIVLTPDSADIAPGEVSTHHIVILDDRGETMSPDWAPRVEWILNDSTRADIEVVGTELRVTAKAKGAVSVYGELGGVERRFDFWVHPLGLDRIEIVPNPVIVGVPGVRGTSVRLFDSQGVEMARRDFRISWSIADTTLATLTYWSADLNRVLVDEDAPTGSTQLTALVSGRTATAEVRVTPQPTPMDVAPSVRAQSPSEIELVWPRNAFAQDGLLGRTLRRRLRAVERDRHDGVQRVQAVSGYDLRRHGPRTRDHLPLPVASM